MVMPEMFEQSVPLGAICKPALPHPKIVDGLELGHLLVYKKSAEELFDGYAKLALQHIIEISCSVRMFAHAEADIDGLYGAFSNPPERERRRRCSARGHRESGENRGTAVLSH